METKFNFKSQMCTTVAQSERLLALGLKKDTADMVWLNHALTEDYDDWRSEPTYMDWEEWQKDGIPAWSLDRLMELVFMYYYNIPFDVMEQFRGETRYEYLIDCIEWLIKEEYFNKEYLV